jgi:hypothetical protein
MNCGSLQPLPRRLKCLETQKGRFEAAPLSATGTGGARQASVVAGGRMIFGGLKSLRAWHLEGPEIAKRWRGPSYYCAAQNPGGFDMPFSRRIQIADPDPIE